MADSPGTDQAAQRALAWHHGRHEAVCDVLREWPGGTVARASRYADYWDYNVVRVERPVDMGADELIAVADRELAGLRHRRIDFDDAADGEGVREEFVARGWRAMRIVVMRHEGPAPDASLAITEVPYEAADKLRAAWHDEDFPGEDHGDYPAQAREVAMLRGVRVFCPVEGGEPVGFAQLERVGDGAEITQVYIRADRRGDGLGTGMTAAAIGAGHDARDLWIYADADDRPRLLYERLGFRPVRTLLELTRRP